jgi:hypothetical protein
MTRFFEGDVPNAAVDQLIGAFSVANRWLVDHPEDAARLIEDPAAVLEAMKTSGALALPVDELLAALRSQRRHAEGKLTARARLVNFLRPTSARFGRKPATVSARSRSKATISTSVRIADGESGYRHRA